MWKCYAISNTTKNYKHRRSRQNWQDSQLHITNVKFGGLLHHWPTTVKFRIRKTAPMMFSFLPKIHHAERKIAKSGKFDQTLNFGLPFPTLTSGQNLASYSEPPVCVAPMTIFSFINVYCRLCGAKNRQNTANLTKFWNLGLLYPPLYRSWPNLECRSAFMLNFTLIGLGLHRPVKIGPYFQFQNSVMALPSGAGQNWTRLCNYRFSSIKDVKIVSKFKRLHGDSVSITLPFKSMTDKQTKTSPPPPHSAAWPYQFAPP